MRLIFATNNRHKMTEIISILPIKYRELAYSIDDVGITVNPDENGTSFIENANIKSLATYRELKNNNLLKAEDIIIADDTGLSIDFFNGEPGIHSARFLGNISQSEKNDKIIEDMKDVKGNDRKCHFTTVLSVIENKKSIFFTDIPTIINFTGRVDGYIADKKIGNEGFGYDPIFAVGSPSDIDKKQVKTYSSMGQVNKNKISHRAKALYLFTNYLEKNYNI